MQEDTWVVLNDFCLHHQIEISFIHSLQEYGLIEVTEREQQILISADRLSEVEKLMRLYYELRVNMEGIDVIQHLLKKLDAAEEELTAVKRQLRFYKTGE